MPVISAGRHRSNKPFAASRWLLSTRAIIKTTAIFASSEGWPSRTPPIANQLLVLAAVPAPCPMKTNTSSRKVAPRYTGNEAHSRKRTDVRVVRYAPVMPSVAQTSCVRQMFSTKVGTSVCPAEYTISVPRPVSASASATSGHSVGTTRDLTRPPCS